MTSRRWDVHTYDCVDAHHDRPPPPERAVARRSCRPRSPRWPPGTCASLLLPDPQPVFACIATVIAIGASHGAAPPARDAARARRRAGLAVADVIIHFIGTGAPQLADHGRAGDVGRRAAQRLRARDLRGRGLRDAARDDRPAGGAAFSPNRILEAVIGGAVALAIALLFSPDPMLPVSRAAQAVFGRLGRALERTASALDDGDAGARRAGARAGALDRGPDARARRRAGHEPRDRAHRADALRRPRADRPLRPHARADRPRRAQHASACAPFAARDPRRRGAGRAARRRLRPRRLRVGAGRRPTTSRERADEARELASAAAVRATTRGRWARGSRSPRSPRPCARPRST